jgi:hypothetical protein
MTKIAGSGSESGSGSISGMDPHQNFLNPEHWQSALAYLDKNQCCAYGFRRAEKASKKDKNFIFLEVYGGMLSLELRRPSWAFEV